ncbi:sensor histidine kinase [Streptomyces sp. FH025]|uniref:sensor histidine kinase n=1 Tax=Streptomyces sp. FH025 TaxID=2815937 RepID=UPI001A9D9911|nr:histidine kinase [Streptomyces sp. FH025]MBO1415271.1 sensor histidine kinase [Streptomyces sp. FH025]
MRRDQGTGPLRWGAEIGLGLYRSAVLTALTCVMALVAVPVGVGGSALAYSWSDGLSAPFAVSALATLGETLMVILWVAVSLWVVHPLTSRALAKAARRCAAAWLGLDLQVTYRQVPPVTRMATGFWWDGHEYHKSEREARRRARMQARFHDPQLHWDGLWALVATVTVLPVAALPLLAVGYGCYMALTPEVTGYGIAVVVAGLAGAPFAWRILLPVGRRFLGPVPSTRLGRRVEELEAIRADLTHTQAVELERIERGLHDGAQARLVAMGMSMGAAERLVDTNPEAAKAILAEARATSVTALAELRSLVRGINPPVLAERGLVDALRALALDSSVSVDVFSQVPSRPERPLESAVYFSVAELLANVAKHSRAERVKVELTYAARTLTATVSDDGIGGAAASTGSGLSGIERRMAAFGGRLEIDSPAGGPTHITVAVPCELS